MIENPRKLYRIYKDSKNAYHCEVHAVIYCNKSYIYYKVHGTDKLARVDRFAIKDEVTKPGSCWNYRYSYQIPDPDELKVIFDEWYDQDFDSSYREINTARVVSREELDQLRHKI